MRLPSMMALFKGEEKKGRGQPSGGVLFFFVDTANEEAKETKRGWGRMK